MKRMSTKAKKRNNAHISELQYLVVYIVFTQNILLAAFLLFSKCQKSICSYVDISENRE